MYLDVYTCDNSLLSIFGDLAPEHILFSDGRQISSTIHGWHACPWSSQGSGFQRLWSLEKGRQAVVNHT